MGIKKAMGQMHSGKTLHDETAAVDISKDALTKAPDIPLHRATLILQGPEGVTADTALWLVRHFGTTPQLWRIFNIPGNCDGVQLPIAGASRSQGAMLENL